MAIWARSSTIAYYTEGDVRADDEINFSSQIDADMDAWRIVHVSNVKLLR